MRRFPLLLLLAALAAACSSTPETPVVAGGALARERDAPPIGTGEDIPEPELLDPNRVVARVNDQTITVRTITAAIGRPEGSPEQIRQALDYYTTGIIADRLFLEAAQRMGIEVTKADLERARQAFEEKAKERGTTLEDDLARQGIPLWEWEQEQRRQILKEKYRYMALGQMQPVSPDTRAEYDAFVRPVEVRDYWERTRDEYREKEEAKLAGVLVLNGRFDGDERKAKEYAEQLVERARGGEDFAAIVKEVQGDSPLGMFEKPFDRKQGFAPGIAEFAWNAPVGSVSDPIAMPAGWLVLKLERRQEARDPGFLEVRDQVEDRVYGLKLAIGTMKIQLDLLDDAVVTPRIYKDRLRKALKIRISEALRELHG